MGLLWLMWMKMGKILGKNINLLEKLYYNFSIPEISPLAADRNIIWFFLSRSLNMLIISVISLSMFLSVFPEGILTRSENGMLRALATMPKLEMEALTLPLSISLMYVGCKPESSASFSCDIFLVFLTALILSPMILRNAFVFIALSILDSKGIINRL